VLKTFGLDLLEIDRHDPNADTAKPSGTAPVLSQATKQKKAKKKSTGLWILRLAPGNNELPYNMNKKQQKDYNNKSIESRRNEFDTEDSLEQAHLGLLMVIVSLIETKKNRLPEEELWKYLAKLNLHKGKYHQKFGLPEKVIQMFEKQLYIEKNKDELSMKKQDATGILYMFQRGSRLRKELINIDDILGFMANVTGFQIDRTTEIEFRNTHAADDEEEEMEEETEQDEVAATPTPPQPVAANRGGIPPFRSNRR